MKARAQRHIGGARSVQRLQSGSYSCRCHVRVTFQKTLHWPAAARPRRTFCISQEWELQPEGDGEALVDFRQQPNMIGLSFREISLGVSQMKVGIWERVSETGKEKPIERFP